MALATSRSLDVKKGTVSIGFENGELYSGKVVLLSSHSKKIFYTTLFQESDMIRYNYNCNLIKNEQERKDQERKRSEEEKNYEEKNQKALDVIEESEDVTSEKAFEPPKKRYLKQQSQLENLCAIPFHMTLRSAVKQYIT